MTQRADLCHWKDIPCEMEFDCDECKYQPARKTSRTEKRILFRRRLLEQMQAEEKNGAESSG